MAGNIDIFVKKKKTYIHKYTREQENFTFYYVKYCSYLIAR